MRSSLVALLAVLSGASACGFDACGGAKESSKSEAPKLERVRLASQLSGDPWTLVFGADFSDSDGDLSNGRALFYLNGDSEPATSQELIDVFRQSGLKLDAQGGELAIPLRFGESLGDGSKVKIGLQMIDGNNNAGNCYPIEVEFDVSPVSSLMSQGFPALALLWQEGL